MAILIHDYAGHPFQVGLSRELARRGIDVIHAFAGGLLTPRGCLERQPGDPEGLRFVELPMHPDYRRDKYNFARRRGYEVAYGRMLREFIVRERPAVVISGNTPSEPQWSAARAAARLGIPFISWVQDFYSVAVHKLVSKRSIVLGWLAGAYYTRIDRRCLQASAHVVTISEDFIPLLRRHGVAANDISVVENWGALDEMPLRPKDNAWARAHGLTGRRVLMYTGTLAMKHNPQRLRELAVRYRRQPDVKILVISEGPSADALKRCAEMERLSNLVVLPFQAFGDMPDVLASADVLLALLEPDAGVFSVPSKILTYLCAGKPTVAAMPAANLGGRLLSRVGAGLVVEPDDREGWLGCTDRLLEDARLRSTMGRSARAHAEHAFDIRRIADRFEQVFARSIQARPQTAPVPEMAVGELRTRANL